MNYSKNAIAIYEKLYFNRDKNDKLIETIPAQCHQRIANVISFNEKETAEFLYILDNNLFRPNSPVLINAGGPKQFLSACYVLGLEDSMDSIIDCWGTCAKIYASGAGAGLTLTNLRKKDGPIAFGGKASGPLSYTKVLDLYSETVKAGNKARRAANMGMLNFNHPDILELLDCKLDRTTLKNFNLSVSMPNKFMEKIVNIERDGEFSFPTYDPKTGINSEDQIEGSYLWNKIINNCWKIGDPGLFFVDTTNEFNPFPKTHPIECTNPCCTGDTLILTNRGYKEIQECINEKTIIWNGYEWSEVIPKITGENQEILKIKFSDGSYLNCTKYHGFKLVNGIQKEAQQLIPGDKLEKWEFPVIHSGINYKNAYTQGVFAGDGSYKRDKPFVWLYDEKKKLLPFINYVKSRENNDRIYIKLDEEIIKEKRFVPNTNWSVKSRLEFLAGLIDTDGTILVDGCIQISSISKSFLQNIKYMLHTLGTTGSIDKSHKRKKKMLPTNKGDGSYKKYNCKACWRITISASRVLKLIDLGLKTNRINLNYCNPDREASRFIKIKEIIKQNYSEEKVYCFNESKRHTGIFNGINTLQCGEVPLWPWSECIIGSINVSNFFSRDTIYQFDWDNFKETVDISFRFLDNCISKTMHPHPNFKETMNKYRPIGLGIMGLADLFVKLKMPYDSTEAISFFETLCYELNNQCIITSINLCKINGRKPIDVPKEDAEHFRELIKYYVRMDGHILNDYDKYGINNCTWTCIAPTGSISISADCSYSFEPLSAIVWQKEMAESHNIMDFVHPGFEDWLRTNYHLDHKKIIQEIINNSGSIQTITEIPQEIRNIFKVAHDIDPYDKINMQAAGQKWISLAISSTCNLPEHATIEDISDIYKYAWTQKLKGITVYRDKSQEWQPINFGKKEGEKIRIPKLDKDGNFGTLDVTKDELIKSYLEKEHEKNIGFTIKTDSVNITFPKQNEILKRPIRRKGETFEIDTPSGKLYCTFNKDEQGRPLEVFLRLGKSGTLENLLLDTISRLISKSLQNSVPYLDISSLLRGIRGDKLWFRIVEDSKEPFSAESIIDAVGIIMEVAFQEEVLKATDIYQHDEYPNTEKMESTIHGRMTYEECPECHRFQLTRDTGCKGGYCLACNFSNCG